MRDAAEELPEEGAGLGEAAAKHLVAAGRRRRGGLAGPVLASSPPRSGGAKWSRVAGGGDWILACGREAARFEKGPPIHLLEDVDAT